MSETPMRGYGPSARVLHWITALLVIATIPLAFLMVQRGAATDFDAATGVMYDAHKAIGMIVLALVVLRLATRLARGAPPEPAFLPAWQRRLAVGVHWLLYGLLLATPLLGWLGTSAFDARMLFGAVELPALVSKDEALADRVFAAHWAAALALAGLTLVHVTAALRHALLGDGVFSRMMSSRPAR